MPPFSITTASHVVRYMHTSSQALSVTSTASTASVEHGQTRNVREYYQALHGSHDKSSSESHTLESPSGVQRHDKTLPNGTWRLCNPLISPQGTVNRLVSLEGDKLA